MSASFPKELLSSSHRVRPDAAKSLLDIHSVGAFEVLMVPPNSSLARSIKRTGDETYERLFGENTITSGSWRGIAPLSCSYWVPKQPGNSTPSSPESTQPKENPMSLLAGEIPKRCPMCDVWYPTLSGKTATKKGLEVKCPTCQHIHLVKKKQAPPSPRRGSFINSLLKACITKPIKFVGNAVLTQLTAVGGGVVAGHYFGEEIISSVLYALKVVTA